MAHRPLSWTHLESWPNRMDFVENGIRLQKKKRIIIHVIQMNE